MTVNYQNKYAISDKNCSICGAIWFELVCHWWHTIFITQKPHKVDLFWHPRFIIRQEIYRKFTILDIKCVILWHTFLIYKYPAKQQTALKVFSYIYMNYFLSISHFTNCISVIRKIQSLQWDYLWFKVLLLYKIVTGNFFVFLQWKTKHGLWKGTFYTWNLIVL